MQRLLAFALSLSIPVGAIGAPFVHAHPDDHATEHHSGPIVHRHWTMHADHHPSSELPTLDDSDHDRAVSLSAGVAVAPTILFTAGPAQAMFVPIMPGEQRAYRSIETVRSHDPPSLQSLSPRAPPALLI